jgi:hypothetical protein
MKVYVTSSYALTPLYPEVATLLVPWLIIFHPEFNNSVKLLSTGFHIVVLVSVSDSDGLIIAIHEMADNPMPQKIRFLTMRILLLLLSIYSSSRGGGRDALAYLGLVRSNTGIDTKVLPNVSNVVQATYACARCDAEGEHWS